MKKVFVKSYGCQMNVYDSHRMIDLLKYHGYALAQKADEADVVILNTCHIREKAEQKLFSDLGRIRDLQKENPCAKIAVGGCVGQALGEEIIKQAPYVSVVFGPQTYHRLPEMLAQIERPLEKDALFKKKHVDIEFPQEVKFDFLPLPEKTQASAFVSVQEGCDKFCTYCVVPYTRGYEYSRPVEAILKEVAHLVDQGVLEIYLLGQNVNAYHGEDSMGNTWSLGRLIYHIADKFPTLQRIRYTTSHPQDMQDDLIQAHADVPSLMPFLHLPIQSGSDVVLEQMNRHHKVSSYLKTIEKLKIARPDIHLSSDFICGFPGETDHDHQETLHVIREVGYAQVYSFKYSERPGTPASVMNNQIPEEVKSQRLHELQAVANHIQLTVNQTMIGKTLPVLFDRPSKHDGQILGRSPYMHSVYAEGSKDDIGCIHSVLIQKAGPNSLGGCIVNA